MKFYETHFEDYIISNQKNNLHPKLDKIFNKFPKKIHEVKNIIFYGPSGVGKYTQALKLLKRYSPSELKYEKKLIVNFNKKQYFFKISDIHYEIDMSLLGCNSKLLWHEIFQQITDSISAKPDKCGIILCKYFNEIHSELLDNFYSYMQKNNACMDLKFFIITEQISFIQDNILNCCQIINISRPTKSNYNKCIKNKIINNISLDNISSIKLLHINNDENNNLINNNPNNNKNLELMQNYRIICDKIIVSIININDIKFLKFRDILYDILICNLNITDCIWYIISKLLETNKLDKKHISNLLIKTYQFFQYYNNNYRPIYHLENYFFYLSSLIHKF